MAAFVSELACFPGGIYEAVPSCDKDLTSAPPTRERDEFPRVESVTIWSTFRRTQCG